MTIFAGLLIAAAAITGPIAVDAVGKPVGFGAGTTGGQGGTTVTPTTFAQLRSYLCGSTDSKGYCTDNTKRIIVINRTFDFRNSLEQKFESGCIVRSCNNDIHELGLSLSGFCNGRRSTSVNYDTTGVHGQLLVGSNKSIIGVKKTGIIKGAGFTLKGGVSNIIIQNLKITDINPHVVWGGDAISIDNARKVWIEHNYFVRIGRQMIVTGYGSASGVTISNNVFDGVTSYSAYCDNTHYWLWLFLGASDSITLYRNYIHNTSGRGPHAGGLNNATIRLHMVNNYFQDLSGQGAIMSRTNTSYILAEGNYFDSVSFPVYKYHTEAGPVYAPFSARTLAACASYIKRSCVVNYATKSSSNWKYTPADTSVLSSLSAYTSALISPARPSSIPSSVSKNAGVGIVN